ncbi:MAG: MBOAT family protein [Lentisphaerota bacterium]
MVFSSLICLFGFLPAVLAACYLAPVRLRNAVLLAASLVFYAWGAPRFVFVLAGSVWLDWEISRRMAAVPSGGPMRRKWLVLSLAVNLALLFFFKYSNFAAVELNVSLAALNLNPVPWAAVALPIGISFFTFQKISYMVDVYRGVTPPSESFGLCLLYIALFPQLIAGPIVRYHDVARQLVSRDYTADRFVSGICRFALGFGKKVLVANVLAGVADAAFAMPAGSLTTLLAWLGVTAYAFQIYFDFSGYSDMAIGLGRMFGLEFLENFDRPYLSRTFTEFWQRWHISLSNFMKEYLYIPLGGNRVSPGRRYVNLWIVFLLSGFWHGAAWNFIVWGAYQGVFLSLDKLCWKKMAGRLPGWLTVPLNFVLVLGGWVFFRAENVGAAWTYLGRMLGLTGIHPVSVPLLYGDLISHRQIVMMLVAALICFLPAFPNARRVLDRLAGLNPDHRGLIPATAGALVILLLSVCSLANSTFNPFIYFRF